MLCGWRCWFKPVALGKSNERLCSTLKGTAYMRLRCVALVFCLMSALAFDQVAVVQRNVNLRSDPSTSSEPIALLKPPARLTLLGADNQNGYYHVRTADGREGWVYGRNVSIAEGSGVPPAPEIPGPTTPSSRVGPADIYPDSVKTPGVANPDITQDNIADNLCSLKWSTKLIRPPTTITSPLKFSQMKTYSDTVADSDAGCMLHSNNVKCYEEDHLISLEDRVCRLCRHHRTHLLESSSDQSQFVESASRRLGVFAGRKLIPQRLLVVLLV
jgi:hypothetical protein